MSSYRHLSIPSGLFPSGFPYQKSLGICLLTIRAIRSAQFSRFHLILRRTLSSNFQFRRNSLSNSHTLLTSRHACLLVFSIFISISNRNSVILTFMGPCIVRIFQYISNKMQHYTVYYIWKLLYMFRVVPPSIIRSAYICIYSIWYLSHRYCYCR